MDILPEVFGEISKWIQISKQASESGGFILGYQHEKTNNISLEYVTSPQLLDIRDRFTFKIRDPKHKKLLSQGQVRKSFYMGVWHTHPQVIPSPSTIDWVDWNDTLIKDRTASEYAFFIIAGTEKIRVWVGDFKTRQIVEIYECEKAGELYKKN